MGKLFVLDLLGTEQDSILNQQILRLLVHNSRFLLNLKRVRRNFLTYSMKSYQKLLPLGTACLQKDLN